MTLADFAPWTIGRLAFVIAAIEALALLFGLLSMAYGRAFGCVYDILIGMGAILTAGLAMLLFPEQRLIDEQFALIGFGLALLGAFVAGLGSVLAATEAVSWFLAQLHVAAGYALIGLWLVLLNYWAGPAHIFPNRAVNMGLFAGAVMALGATAIPGVLMRSEDESTAPWMSRYVGRAGNLGWLLLFPIWCLWLGLSRL